MKTLKVAIDIDDVLADFVPSLFLEMREELIPHDHWDRQGPTGVLFQEAEKIGLLDKPEFWLNMSPLMHRDEIDRVFYPDLSSGYLGHQYDIVCYMTASRRNVAHVRREWLRSNGFPTLPMVQTLDKLKAMQDLGVDLLIDDSKTNVQRVIEGGKMALQYLPWYSEGTTYKGKYAIKNWFELYHKIEHIMSGEDQQDLFGPSWVVPTFDPNDAKF